MECNEESPKLKSKLLLSILAMFAAAFMPLATNSQLIHARHSEAPAEKAVASHKYEVFAGYGYTSMNQVNQSRYGLQGAEVSVTRDWGRFFGLTADGAIYKYPLGHPAIQNGGTLTPALDAVLLGPVVHAKLFGHYDGFFHVLLGGEHIGFTGSPGVTAYPNLSFAGGVGGGMDYNLTSHFSLRASGDDIVSSFVAPVYPANPPPPPGTCTTNSGCSSQMHRSSRASFGLVYKF
jgi:hypothetical protein